MKKRLLFICTCFLCFSMGYSQNYNSAIGARLGYPVSVSYKKFVSGSDAFEVYAGFRNFSTYNWFNISGAYQIHADLGDTEGLQWYYGFGASVFVWSFDTSFLGDNSTGTTFGLQGYLGLDYAFSEAPLSITLDWVPTFFLNGFGSGLGGGYGALGVRYILAE